MRKGLNKLNNFSVLRMSFGLLKNKKKRKVLQPKNTRNFRKRTEKMNLSFMNLDKCCNLKAVKENWESSDEMYGTEKP